VAPEYAGFFHREFVADPIGYLQRYGRPKKPVKLHRTIKVFELDGPILGAAQPVTAIAKIVTPEKLVLLDRHHHRVTDPLLELRILLWLQTLGLPGAAPIGHARIGEQVVILYRKLPGLTTKDAEVRRLFASHGEAAIRRDIDQRLAEIRPAYERAGIHRPHWRGKDSVFTVESSGRVTGAIPIDWERTRIDWSRLDAALASGGGKASCG
jgi:hypothetical protein